MAKSSGAFENRRRVRWGRIGLTPRDTASIIPQEAFFALPKKASRAAEKARLRPAEEHTSETAFSPGPSAKPGTPRVGPRPPAEATSAPVARIPAKPPHSWLRELLNLPARMAFFLYRNDGLPLPAPSDGSRKEGCRSGGRSARKFARWGSPMPIGTVKWFNETKGYGFIAPEGGGKDVFVHISAVQRSGLKSLSENQKVSFELRTGRDGRQSATDLKPL